MRLWHQGLIASLPRQQLLGQHRECCGLRGNGWNKKHKTINYIFKYNPYLLYLYHLVVMIEMTKRKYKIDKKWTDPRYRGKKCIAWDLNRFDYFENDVKHENYKKYWFYYQEHNDDYLKECLKNLEDKGIIINKLKIKENYK